MRSSSGRNDGFPTTEATEGHRERNEDYEEARKAGDEQRPNG